MRKGEAHTLDEALGEDAGLVTVTVGCSDEASGVVCIVMTVNAGDREGGASTSEGIGGGYGGPGKVCTLWDSVVRGPLTDLSGVLDGCADDRADVPDGETVSWKYA